MTCAPDGRKKMDDYLKYDFTLTIDQLKKNQKEYDGNIMVIINGYYYDLKKEED